MKKMSAIERLQVNNELSQKKKRKKLDTFVTAVFFYWILFVIVAWITFWVKDSIPDTLIQYGLGGGAFELLITGAIEIVKGFHSKKEE